MKEGRFKLKGVEVIVEKGDLTKQNVDAIVNPANSELSHGSGAAGCIRKASAEPYHKYDKINV